MVRAALFKSPVAGKPEIPPAKSREEVLVLLNIGIQEMDRLNGMLKATGVTDEADTLDLSKLSVDEKLTLGDEQSRKLAALAFKLAPEKTLDTLETKLERDLSSQRATIDLLQKFRG